MVDAAPEGLEVLRGNSSYIYNGNWKLQMENGADGYHVSSVHWNYAATMGHRSYDEAGTRAVDPDGWSKSVGGVYAFENGHILLWTQLLNPEVRPVYAHREALAQRVGQERADFIVNQTRNLALYPNVYLMDQFSTQIRVVRPISVNETGSDDLLLCPKKAPPSARCASANMRISSTCQAWERPTIWRNSAPVSQPTKALAVCGTICRGCASLDCRPDANATAMGLEPILSGERSEDEPVRAPA
jgi:benzoate/toluate 1,2-dioxygenase alpha subunit